jgi:Mannosyltransferase (PIG-V)
VHDSARALLGSRALVWVVGVGTILIFGFGPTRGAFDPPGVTRGFGRLGDLLAAPAARWDSAWYLVIAHYGYRPDLAPFGTSARAAFYPLYPLGLRTLSDFGLPPVLAGVALSMFAFALALYGIHRLTALELGASGRPGAGETARLAVMLVAFAPMGLYFSAVYTESLYLALSVGLFWCARHGRWALVGLLGAAAAATRNAGIVLALPALLLYLYGPREDRPPDRAGGTHWPREDSVPDRAGGIRPLERPRWDRLRHWLWGLLRQLYRQRLRPRYRLRPDILWLALVPLGLVAYMTYLALSGGDLLLPFHAEAVWGRHFVGPFVGVWDGVKAAFEGARQLLSFQRQHVYFPIASGDPFVAAGHDLLGLAFLLAAVAAIIGVLRLLPLAYGAYVLAALALALSYPVTSQPLMSLPRFLVVLFPLSMWFAAWLAAHPRARAPVLATSAALMASFAAEFATWHWVA